MYSAANRWMHVDALEGLTDVEYARMSILMRSIYQKLEGRCFLYKYGLLDAARWQQHRRIGRGMIDAPSKRVWWENEIGIATFSPDFVKEIESAQPIDASLINRRPDT